MDTTPYIEIKEKCERVFRGKYGIFDEDVIYDTMVSIIFQYKKNKDQIRNLNAWLMGAIHHHYCSYISQKTRERSTFQYDYFIEEKQVEDGDFAENKIDAALVKAEIGHLDPPYCDIMRMRLLEGYSHKEIAEELEIRESTIRKYYSRSLKKITSLLRSVSHILLICYLLSIHT